MLIQHLLSFVWGDSIKQMRERLAYIMHSCTQLIICCLMEDKTLFIQGEGPATKTNGTKRLAKHWSIDTPGIKYIGNTRVA